MKNRKFISLTTALVLLSSIILSGCGSEASAGSGAENGVAETNTADKGYTATTMRIAIQPSAAFVPIYLLRDNGWLDEEASKLGVTVEWTEFVSGPPMNESFAAGQQDIGFIGDVPTVSAIFSGQPNTVVGTAAYGEAGYAVLIPQGSTITGPADLAGKKFGLTIGSTAHNIVAKYLKQGGLDINTDVEVVNLTVGDLATALTDGQIDAAAVWEPSITRLTESGAAVILADGSGFHRGTNTIFATTAFATANPALIQLLLEQYARAAQALKADPGTEAAKVAEAYSLTPEQLVKVVSKYTYSVNIDDADIECLRGTTEFLREIGVVTDDSFDIADYMDQSYANNANLAKYQ
jgi:sulfonate transport system substrate-binding protein